MNAGRDLSAASGAGDLFATVPELAAEFGDRFIIGAVRSRDGISLAAVKNDHGDEPGLYAVITDDAGELRDALLEDEQDSPPGSETQPGGG